VRSWIVLLSLAPNRFAGKYSAFVAKLNLRRRWGILSIRRIIGVTLKQQIISDLTVSMKAQDGPRTSTLRMVKAALMNREIEKGGELDDEEMMKLLRSLVKQRRDSVEQYEKGGREDLAGKEKAEIEIIDTYLPKAASREEVEAAVSAAIIETGASSMKEMGKVMKAVQAGLAGKNADGRMLSEVVRAKLTG